MKKFDTANTDRRTNRSDIYAVLARVFEKEADAELIRFFQKDNWIQLLGENITSIEGIPKTEVLEHLAEEYARLFVGPGHHLSPYASVWNGEGSLWGHSTVQLIRSIQQIGLSLRQNGGKLPDHISIILEYMFRLIHHEWSVQDKDSELKALLAIQFDVFNKLLFPWAPKFLEKIVEECDYPFYKKLSIFAINFFEAEKEYFQI